MVKLSDGSFKRVSLGDAIATLDNIRREGKNKFTIRDIKKLYPHYSLGRCNGIIRKLSDRNIVRFVEKEKVKSKNTTRNINKFEIIWNNDDEWKDNEWK